MRTVVQSLVVAVEQPMLPSEPPNDAANNSKRKFNDERDLLGKPVKKTKHDASGKPNTTVRRKLPGEQQIGGLVITLGPPARPPSSQETRKPTSSSAPRPPSSQSRRPPESTASTSSVQLSQNPLNGFSTSTNARSKMKGKEREIPAISADGDTDVEEDVRRMNVEAEDLRRQSHSRKASLASNQLLPDFQFPPPPGTAGKPRQLQQLRGDLGKVTLKSSMRDTIQPIPEHETPQIHKNKVFRGERTPAKSGTATGPIFNHGVGPPSIRRDPETPSRRRSSLGMRGKRNSSCFDSGVITRPHTSVPNSSLYKHIDPDLPDTERARQLLIWASFRSMPDTPGSSTPQRHKPPSTSTASEASLPTLPVGGVELLREIEEDVIKQLAEKMIDISLFDPNQPISPMKVKDNEQNVKNRAREKKFMQEIEERKAEEKAWAEVSQFYNTHRANVLSALEMQNRSGIPTSAKAKGKQKATSGEADDLLPRERELPEAFQGANGFEMARRLLGLGVSSVGEPDPRFSDLQYKEDRLHASVSSIYQFTQVAASDLDHRFALLSLSLSQRSQLISHSTLSSNTSAISTYMPIKSLPHLQQPTTDPQDILRALTQMDAARPRAKVGDAARRAANDVQRVQDVGDGGLGERKLTDVPPPTPRKPPGTPRRPGTPGTGRRG